MTVVRSFHEWISFPSTLTTSSFSFKPASAAANQGVTTVISLMALLSMNLGIVNLLPIPALDGGKLVLNIFEGIRGKPLSQEKEGILTLAGFGFLMLLMVLVTWNDIQRFFF